MFININTYHIIVTEHHLDVELHGLMQYFQRH